MILVTRSMSQASKEFQETNASGQGYMEYMTNLHDELGNDVLKKASSHEVSATLKQLLMESKANWANKTFKEQTEMTASYAMTKFDENATAILTELVSNPDNVTSLFGQYNVAVSTLDGVLPKAEFEKATQEKLKEFAYFHGLGLIDKDPYAAKEMIL